MTAVLALLVVPGALVFGASGEARGLAEIAQIQVQAGGLYKPYLEVDEYAYKLDLYRARQPDTVLIGSSLGLFLRAGSMQGSFVNAGRTMPYIGYGPGLVRSLTAIHRPKLVLFVLDPWWFNAGFEDRERQAPPADKLPHWSLRRMLEPYAWLASGVIGPAKFLAMMAGSTGGESPRSWGLLAQLNDAGYDGWGAMQTADTPARAPEFPETMERIAHGGSRFEPGAAISEARWATYLSTLAEIEASGARTVVILPPIAGRVQKAMRETGRYGYVDELRQRLAGMPLTFDFLDPASIGSDDCEFLSDGFHTAPVAWARIALTLARALPGDLGAAFSSDGARKEIERFERLPRPSGTEPSACRA